MDYIRSAYVANFRFEPGGPLVPVQWFFAKPGAQHFPGQHGYYSLQWEDSHLAAPVGEQGNSSTHVYSLGQGPAELNGRCVKCVNPALFNSDGSPPGVIPPVQVNSAGVPITCLRAPPGGLLFEGQSLNTSQGTYALEKLPLYVSLSGCTGFFSAGEGQTYLIPYLGGGLWGGCNFIGPPVLCWGGQATGTNGGSYLFTWRVWLTTIGGLLLGTGSQSWRWNPFPPVNQVFTYADGFGNGFTATFHN